MYLNKYVRINTFQIFLINTQKLEVFRFSLDKEFHLHFTQKNWWNIIFLQSLSKYFALCWKEEIRGAVQRKACQSSSLLMNDHFFLCPFLLTPQLFYKFTIKTKSLTHPLHAVIWPWGWDSKSHFFSYACSLPQFPPNAATRGRLNGKLLPPFPCSSSPKGPSPGWEIFLALLSSLGTRFCRTTSSSSSHLPRAPQGFRVLALLGCKVRILWETWYGRERETMKTKLKILLVCRGNSFS